MELTCEKIGSRYANFTIEDGGKYYTASHLNVFVDGEEINVNTSSFTVYDLKPDSEFKVLIIDSNGSVRVEKTYRTLSESVTLSAKDFGAKGDGKSDDTAFIQACIMACPKGGRVLIEEGSYLINTIYLKSNLRIEIAKGACLLAISDKELRAHLPGSVQCYNEEDIIEFGTWEGNPRPMYEAVVAGYNVSNVEIYGRGTIDGNASVENWWKNPKQLDVAYRPRTIFLKDCENISITGISVKNSPSWTVHPFFSKKISLLDMTIENPNDSPNTDGIDPESSSDVLIKGVSFNLGDDCVAIKSGKIYMGKKYKTPSENIKIMHCLMQNGHGAVTIGSEIAGGVNNVFVSNCEFINTDRGLRIKTRRGRGKDSVIDNVCFKDIDMNNVKTPFTVNEFYYCDPDGKSEYVQTREILQADEKTPEIKSLMFENIKALKAHVCAAYIEGLPEKKIENIAFRNVTVEFSKDAKEDVPIMSMNVGKMKNGGLIVKSVKNLLIENVNIIGATTEKFVLSDVEKVN